MLNSLPPVVVCIKVGTKYNFEYVNNLAAMVERHANVQHYFLCFTDDPTGLTCAHARIGTDLPGWWAKLFLFHPQNELQDHRVFFMDLDTVIVGNIDLVLAYDGPFAILSDFYHPEHYGSAIMSIPPGFGRHIWTEYTPEQHGKYWGDQAWIESRAPGADRWQDLFPGQCVSYKVHCQDGGPPPDARIICFHGSPSPHEVTHLPFMQEHWHDRTPVAG